MTSVNFRSKSELAYSWMRDAIIDSTLQPGSRLVIDDLAAQLGVSQIPIREALNHLQAEGFVSVQPHVGATVTEIQPALVSEIFGLLEMAEVLCGQEACRHISSRFVEEMKKMLHEADGLVNEPDQFSKANTHFHLYICRHGSTLFLQKIVERIWLHWDRLRCSYLNPVFARQTHIAQQEHWDLFAALQDADEIRVAEITRQHNRRALEAYTRFMHQSEENTVPS